MSDYIERAVAFMDILGMRTLVARISDDDALRCNLHNALWLIKEQERYSSEISEFIPEIQVSVFSDCIALSISPEKIGILVNVCSDIQNRLLHLGIAIRGGIAVGKAIHENGILYGEGFCRAYDIERNFAKNPRIMLDDNIEDQYPIFISSEYLDTDDDLRRIVTPMVDTPFSGEAADLAAEGYDPRSLFMTDVRHHIIRNLRESKGEAYFGKWLWLAQRFNGAIRARCCYPPLAEIEIPV